MNRCHTKPARLALAALLALPAALPALPALPVFIAALAPVHADAQEAIRREAPKDVVLGKMTVNLPPDVLMDGKADRLSPGSRIRDTRNMLVLSASLSGQTVPVVYKRDSAGLVHDVWLLTPDEYKQLAGVSPSGSQGLQQFVEVLALIFGARR